MKQITEEYCSFEVAKLLKEKGFNENCHALYDVNTKQIDIKNVGDVFNNKQWENYISAPSQSLALKWLSEVHDLHIIVYPWQADNEEKAIHWCCTVYKSFAHLGNDVYTNETPKSYEEAVEAALLYVLKNLI